MSGTVKCIITIS